MFLWKKGVYVLHAATNAEFGKGAMLLDLPPRTSLVQPLNLNSWRASSHIHLYF